MDDLQESDIARRELIGWCRGAPVYAVETTGGFNLILVLRNGRLEPLSQGPHPGIAIGLAKKREPAIQLVQLAKADQGLDLDGPTARYYQALSDQLRARMGF